MHDLHAPGPERFLPCLAGERPPHDDAGIRAALTGLGTQTTLPDLTRAVLQGVAIGLRDSAGAMKRTGAEIGPLFAVGGGAALQYWVRLLATGPGVPLFLPANREFGAALGAARLAIVASTDRSPET